MYSLLEVYDKNIKKLERVVEQLNETLKQLKEEREKVLKSELEKNRKFISLTISEAFSGKISQRTLTFLEKHFTTVEDLLGTSETFLLRFRGVGEGMLSEIKNLLVKRGLTIGP